MQTVSPSVAQFRDTQSNIALIQRAPRKPQSAAQKAVASLTPIFNACRERGLAINEGNRLTRAHAINMYFHNGDLPFLWIIDSFKELMKDPGAVEVVADAIEGGALTW